MKRLLPLLILFTGVTMISSTFASAQQIPDAATDPRINHQVRAFLAELDKDSSPFWLLPGPQVRATLTGLQDKTPVDMSGVTISERVIAQDGRSVKIYIVRPQDAEAKPPVLFFIHGGVWIAGDFDNHKRFVRDLVVGSGAIAVFPEYTPIPDAVFPTQIEECYAALKWTASHGGELGADTSRIAIAGNSVGGNMTAVMAMLAKERGGPALKVQILFWPATDASVDTQSYHEFATGRFLTRDFMKFGWDIYAPKPAQRNDPHVSPLRASLEELEGLPPALVQTEENDPLRDEGEAYAHKLDEAGVTVVATRYIGQIHDFGILNAIRDVPSTQAAIREATETLRQYLGSEHEAQVGAYTEGAQHEAAYVPAQ
jgi:acetyl esterase